MAKKKSTVDDLKRQGRNLGKEVARRGGKLVDQGQRLAREGADRLEAMSPKRRKKASVARRALATATGVAAAAAAGVAAVAGAAAMSAAGKRGAGAAAATAKRFRVVPRREGWAVEAGGRVQSRHATKKEAVATAREAARRNAPSQLIIQNADGSEQSSHSYEA